MQSGSQLDPENDPKYANLIRLLREMADHEPDPDWKAKVWARVERRRWFRRLWWSVAVTSGFLMISACSHC